MRTINLQNRKEVRFVHGLGGYVLLAIAAYVPVGFFSDSFVRFHNVVGRVVSNLIVPRGGREGKVEYVETRLLCGTPESINGAVPVDKRNLSQVDFLSRDLPPRGL